MGRVKKVVVALGAALCLGVLLTACSAGSPPSASPPSTTATNGSVPLVAAGRTAAKYLVYWDQNEEEDFLSMPSGLEGQLTPPWDPNGQMCLLPDGRFV